MTYKYFGGTTYCSTAPYVEPPSPPENKALNDLIEKFHEYRKTLSEEKDKKELDDFLELIRKSSS